MNPRTNKLTVSQDVICDETQAWHWGNGQNIASHSITHLISPNQVDQPSISVGVRIFDDDNLDSESEGYVRKFRSLRDIYDYVMLHFFLVTCKIMKKPLKKMFGKKLKLRRQQALRKTNMRAC